MKNLKHQNKITIFVCLFITLLIFYAYYPVKNAVFIDFDDNQYVTDNLIVQKGLTVEGIIWAFKSIYAANWHPLTWISHMLDCELYGLSPAGHHWTNVQFHILNSILLFFFLFKYTGKVVAKHTGCGFICCSSHACRIRCLGGRKKGCIKYFFRHVDVIGIWEIR